MNKSNNPNRPPKGPGPGGESQEEIRERVVREFAQEMPLIPNPALVWETAQDEEEEEEEGYARVTLTVETNHGELLRLEAAAYDSPDHNRDIVRIAARDVFNAAKGAGL